MTKKCAFYNIIYFPAYFDSYACRKPILYVKLSETEIGSGLETMKNYYTRKWSISPPGFYIDKWSFYHDI